MRRFFIILTLILPWLAFAADESYNQNQNQDKDNTERRQLTWRVFSKLSQKEREELIELQRTDPEKYKKLLQQKVEELRLLDQTKREELRSAYEEWKSATPERKAEIRKNLEQKVRAEYEARLTDNRRQLEEMKKRAADLEKELNKREADTENQVQQRIDNILKGKFGPAKEDRDNKNKDKNK